MGGDWRLLAVIGRDRRPVAARARAARAQRFLLASSR